MQERGIFYVINIYRFELTETVRIREKVRHGGSPGVMHRHGTIHELDPTGFAGLNDGVELGCIEGHGLLKQNMLFLLGREYGPTEMEAGRQWHVDGVDFGVVEEGLVRAVDIGVRREAVGCCECLGLVDRTAGNGV